MKKVLGVGNALVDIIFFLENDNLLLDFGLPKGSMQLVDSDKAVLVEKSASHCKKYMASGGSAANTIHGLAKLGVDTAFIGTVGSDIFGDFFGKDMLACKIDPVLSIGNSSTGRAISLVSTDGERTFATYLGAAIELSTKPFETDFIKKYDHLHLEGYLVPNQDLTEKILYSAKKNRMSISLDLASFNVVEANLQFLKKIITEFKPVVFANEEEARSFTNENDPKRALDILSEYSNTVIVKTGAKGSLIFDNGKKYSSDAITVKCLDTTGAGDLYAAGYLYGFINNFKPDKCAKIASLLAGKVIEEAGAKICESSWQFIEKELKNY